eukprot:663143-Rhodomonas_salina.2
MGGSNASGIQMLKVLVVAVNHPPSFSVPPSITVVEGESVYIIPQFVSNVDPGPGEAHQTVSFDLTFVQPEISLFSMPPILKTTRELEFEVSYVAIIS